MASIVDVEKAIQVAVSNALNAANVTIPNQVVRGWPSFTSLTKILQKGQFQVSVFSEPNARNVTRFIPEWGVLGSMPSKTLTATISGSRVTFGGSVATVHNVHTFVGGYSSGVPLSDGYAQAAVGDSLSTVATKVAAAINGLALSGVSATASGAAVTVSGAPLVECRIGVQAPLAKEVRRTERQVRVTCWCPKPEIRDQVGPVVELAIGYAGNYWLALADGSSAKITYVSSYPVDEPTKDMSLFRYDVLFCAEFASYVNETGAQVESWGLTETYQVNLTNDQIQITEEFG